MSIKPIGYIRTSMGLKFDAPQQPDKRRNETSVIELLPKQDFEQALIDLSGFDYIWLVWWFHKNNNWKPMVMPPRGKPKRRGVFATRSPHRPNPIGLTAVPLLGIKGRKLTVGTNDLVDGTPILDIKPYLITADCFPDVRQGWIGEVENELNSAVKHEVTYSSTAKSQLTWLKSQGVNFIERAAELLGLDPTPHRTRRIVKCSMAGEEDLHRMSCGAWRIFYSWSRGSVKVKEITPGYPPGSLQGKQQKKVPFFKEQLAFLAKWPNSKYY